MKTIPLLTACSTLLLSSQSFSQDSVATGGGGNSDGGMGTINMDVPAEGEDDNPSPGHENETTNDTTPSQFQGSIQLDLGAFYKGWTVPSVASSGSESTSLIIIVDEPGKDDNGTDWSVPVREWRVPSSGKIANRPVDPDVKFRNRINTQDKVNSGTRPRIVLRGDEKTSCPNGGGSKYDDNTPRDKTPQYPSCDCCCHESSSRLRKLFESSNNWDDYQGNAYTQYDNGKDDVNRYGDDGHKDDDSQCHSDDNSPGQSYTYDNDDCDCSCDCHKPFGIAMYD